MLKSSFVMPDIGIPSDRQTIEEQGAAQAAPPATAPFPVLLLVFALLGYLALRQVWIK